MALLSYARRFLPDDHCGKTHGLRPSLRGRLVGPQVDMVLLPSTSGDFGVMPGHVPTVAQLRPGVVTVHSEMDKQVEKYFVAAGFAFIHADSSTDLCAVEAVKLDELDPEAVRAGLAEYTAKLASSQVRRHRLLLKVPSFRVQAESPNVDGIRDQNGRRTHMCAV